MTEPATSTRPAPPLTSPLPTTPAEWAEVHAGDVVIRYRRLGRGRTVLALRPPGVGLAAPWPELLDALAAGHRLIVPEPPTGEADSVGWLGAFLEGLGCADVVIVVAAPVGVPTPMPVLGRCSEIACVVLVAGAAGDPDAGLDPGPDDPAGDDGLPVLVVPRALPAAEAVRRVLGFVDGVSGDAGAAH